MRTYRYCNYKALSRQIHAPQDLKNSVLAAATHSHSAESKQPANRNRRGLRFLPKAAVAAVLAIVLPMTVFGAAKSLGLIERLSQSGLQDTQTAQELSFNIAEKTSYRNSYAEYTFMEAVCDSNTLYLSAEIKPLDDSTLLVPQFVTEDEAVSDLQIEGVAQGTVGEYAASLGKTLVYTDIGYRNGDEHLDGSVDFRCSADGTLYYFYSTTNTFGTSQIDLSCTGLAYTAGMSVADRVEFKVELFDKSHTTEKVYTVFDEKAADETGIHISNLILQETELGLYATIKFTIDDPEAWRDCLSFKLQDASGAELASMPGISLGITENGDGTYSAALSYQKPNSSDDLRFIMRNYVTGEVFGPYSFE